MTSQGQSSGYAADRFSAAVASIPLQRSNLMNRDALRPLAAAAVATVILLAAMPGAVRAQLVGDDTIASDGTIRGSVRSTAGACTGRIELVGDREGITCGGVRLACEMAWAADVSPIAGREWGAVCANVPLDEQFLPVYVENVEEIHRRAFVVSAARDVLVDSGELESFGLRFYPLPLLNETLYQVVLGATYESPWDSVILDWGRPDGRPRVVFHDVGNLLSVSANLNGTSQGALQIVACSGTWRWNPSTRQFTPPRSRPRQPPPACAFSYGDDGDD